ncbi:hypothetical protein BJ170DRAFT_315599 [Xylariales sp. AK1849]|nr:hypothetical protein BJ170DRAFT_315599 [Xylariales sp. AK1849]
MADQETLIGLLGSYNNFNEPKPSWNYASTMVPTIIVFHVLAYICVILRLYTRFRVIYSPGWDDLFVVLVLLLGTAGAVCLCLATQHGFGEHFLLLPYADTIAYLKLFYVANATYSMCTALVKLALLLQYLRIFKDRPTRWLCIGLIIVTSLWGTAYSFMAWFPCFPVSAYWDWTITARTCYAYGSLYPTAFYATYSSASAINMLLDVIIMLIPVPLYFRKNTDNRTRLGLVGLLLMGGLVNFLSIWRLATIVDHKATTSPTFDPTWYGPISILLANLEVDLATICASVPVFWPVLTSKLDKILVTQEIKIEREHRFSAIDDEYELQRNGDGEYPSEVLHSRTTSESSLHRAQSRPGKDGHYKDKYIMAQVNPLSSVGTVESEITSQPTGRKQSRTGL